MKNTIGFAFLALLAFSCGGSATNNNGTGTSPPEDTGTGEADTGSETQNTDTGSETVEVPDAQIAEACSHEGMPSWHPNHDLPRCANELRCIYTDDEGWCSDRCDTVGATNTEDQQLDGWCCGDLVPCESEHFWLPPSMSYSCIPRSALLGETCDRSSQWTGSERRCAPICGSGPPVSVDCVNDEQGSTLCTMDCDPADETNCLLEAAFENGCCDLLGNHNYCLPQRLCD